MRHRVLLAVFSAFLLACCTARPPVSDYPRTPSSALPQAETQSTPLGQAVAPGEKTHPGESGFHLLPTGQAGLVARLAAVRAAAKTLDLQYYSVEDDHTGNQILSEILAAADRGVRVRLLVDDLSLEDIESVLKVLNQNANIEIRAFNPPVTKDQLPFARIGDFLTASKHLMRRMHNKALIVDNQVAIIGGRNLGDEYFDANADVDFNDMDVLAAGPIAGDISRTFDRYWNGEEAYPISAIVAAPKVKLHKDPMPKAPEQDGKTPALPALLGSSEVPLIWARAELAADDPAKIDKADDVPNSKPVRYIDRMAQGAQHEFLVISPYFVPRDSGVAWLGALVKRGIAVHVLTNSLASTDVVMVHAGYSRYRKALLEAGVDLYEFKNHPGERPHRVASPSGSSASLHAKVYVVDRSDLVIGSFNLDPRSVYLNTEMSLIIHSPEMAGQVADIFARIASPKSSYRVVLENGKLVWITEKNGLTMHYTSDPEAGLWRNILNDVFSLLPVESQL